MDPNFFPGPKPDRGLTEKGTHSVAMNGGKLYFSVGTRETPDGFVGWITLGGVEVYVTGPQENAEDAAVTATRHATRVFGKLLAA